jgi:hypothetical protein
MLSDQEISSAAKTALDTARKVVKGNDVMVATRGGNCFVLAGWESQKDVNAVALRAIEVAERTGCTILGMARSQDSTECLIRTSSPDTVRMVRDHAPIVFGDGVNLRFTI